MLAVWIGEREGGTVSELMGKGMGVKVRVSERERVRECKRK